MKKAHLLLLLLAFTVQLLSAQNTGYRIAVELDSFDAKEAYLGYYYGDKPYLKDTVQVTSKGKFVFQGEEALDGGVYLIVLPPDNQFIQIFVSEDDQHFKVKANAKHINGTVQIEGSPDNKRLYNYLSFIGELIQRKNVLLAEKEKADEKRKATIEEELKQMDKQVEAYHMDIITKHPKSLTAAFIANRLNPPIPEFEGTDEEKQLKRWKYIRAHYFDYYDMTDPRMVHSPFFFQRIDHYVNKLTVQHPDSISLAIDEILQKVKPAEKTFQFYLVHFLNTYAKSKIVGMDAVYVHLVENYYEKGLAPWTEEEQLKKIIKNAKTLKPILIGKIAPNITLQKRDKSTLSLHDVKADFTVLFFWDPDCGHCKKSMPKMIEVYEKFKNKGVEVFAVCTKLTDKVPKCWEYIDDKKGMDRWLNLVDPFLKSRYKQIYDVRSTPQIFVLDHKKEILTKRIGAEQLEEALDMFIQLKKEGKL